MKSIQITEHGNPDVLKVVEIDEPSCPSDKIKIKIKACGINHLDIWVRKGLKNIRFSFPHILGSDGSGTIVETGDSVKQFMQGDDVVIQPGTFSNSCNFVKEGKENYSNNYGILGETESGVQSDYVVLDPINVHKKASHLSFEQAAGMQLVFMTAHQMLVKRAELQQHETVLIYGGASGVGSAAIQIVKDIGATVIATVGDKSKINYAYEMGADYVILHNEGKIKNLISDVCDKKGVDVVFEHIGLATWKDSLKVLNKGGRIVTCGATTGNLVELDLAHLFIKQQSILGSTMADMSTFTSVMEKINNKIYKPFVDRIFNFNDVKNAHIRIENRKQMGKVILVP